MKLIILLLLLVGAIAPAHLKLFKRRSDSMGLDRRTQGCPTNYGCGYPNMGNGCVGTGMNMGCSRGCGCAPKNCGCSKPKPEPKPVCNCTKENKEDDDSCVSIGNSGKLCGKTGSVLGKDIVTYFSVPFAKPPVGELRFMPPEPLEPLSEKVNAFELSPACPQGRDDTFPHFWGSNMWNPNTPVTEDCLYMNIWAPKNATNLPVMIWIFGGGFYSGSPSLEVYDASAMAAENNIVVVNINYRVGLFGFGYLNATGMPGNMGLLDQRMAMQWVADNIASLGGDPSAVTIFGESAGAASVSAHALAPESQPLFQAAIMQSGSVLAPWAMDSPERAIEKTLGIAKDAGCVETTNADEVIKCLKEKPMQEIIDVTGIWSGLRFMEFGAVPVSEDPNFFGEGTSAHKLLAEGDFSGKKYLMGVMADEAAFFILYYMPAYFNRDQPWELSRSQYIQAAEEALTGSGGNLAVDECYQNATISRYEELVDTYANSLDEMIGDEKFACSVMDFSRDLAKTSPDVRLYFFNHTVSTNPWPRDMGVLHGYEIEPIFGLPLINDTYTEDERDFAKRLLNIWTALRTGDDMVFNNWPTVSSNPEDANSVKVLQTPADGNIDGFLNDFKTKECTFWKDFKDGAECPQ